MEVVTLYRPTGSKELVLVEQSGFARWPPCLPEQSIFYPVTNEAYAKQNYEIQKVGVRFIPNGGFRRRSWKR